MPHSFSTRRPAPKAGKPESVQHTPVGIETRPRPLDLAEQASRAGCVQYLFEDVVTRTPGAEAVVCERTALTYAELNARANQLGRHLTGLGVGPDTLVGVFTHRSPSMLVALLGILKAGGAYVPLDPIYPAERVAYVLADAGAEILLTESELVGALGPVAARLVCLDRDWPAITHESTDNLPRRADASHLAYVIYTSGSTGGPKGVQIEHGALVNLLESMRREPGMCAEDTLLAVTTVSFDIAGLELFLPLVVGARVVLTPWHIAADGTELLRTIEQNHVSMMQATPATWRLLLDAGWQGTPNLKILCGGESLPRDLAAQLIPRCAQLWNMYGPTETTIWSTCGRVHNPDDRSIGRPIANTAACIVDENHRPVPPGTAGELLLGGAGLARGYFRRPDLTAEKFVFIPSQPAVRLYRTGDLARFREDGNIDCLGRLDFQIKIRGFRIEPDEIESVLTQHPDVQQAVVIAREDTPGDKRLVAYLGTQSDAGPDHGELRTLLRTHVPDYMVPAAFVVLKRLPLTPNGKIDRQALPRPETGPGRATRRWAAPRTPLETTISGVWQEVLGIEEVGLEENFFDLGGHSLQLGRAHARLRGLLQRDFSIVELYQHPTVGSLAAHFSPESGKRKTRPAARAIRPATTPVNEPVAIIGMAGRFPGAEDLEQFWNNLRTGVESITFFSADEMRAAGVSEELIKNPAYVPAKSTVDGVECFDAHFFGYSPGEAAGMDPQQRIFLETAWSALEDAGHDPEQSADVVGVYAGASPNLHLFRVLAQDRVQGYGFPLTIQHEKDYLATRVSYELNLKGPSVSVLTACSTSLVAVHMACRSLLGGECDLALAGAVSAQVPQHRGYLFHEGGIGSNDGHCRVFDAGATGTVFGNGVGVVVLKRLSRALRDGDTIRAVIRGTAINNDGSGKVGFMAPSVDGQADVIALAHRAAGINADDISYVEAHGTGTVVGDPIEIAALTQAFRRATNRSEFCTLGSVKANIGHLDAAAGMAGLIKTVLALEHRELPPNIHFREPNPQIDFARSPFAVNAALAEWKSAGPRRAGVSSFGVGGTNAHVVVEEAVAPSPAPQPAQKHQLLLFSGRTAAALDRIITNFRDRLTACPALDLADAAYTLQVGRRAMEHRCMLVCDGRDEALSALAAAQLARGGGEVAPPKVVFMFSGQGSQYAGMAGGLYREEPRFAQVVDECLELLRGHLDFDLRPVLLADSAGAALPDLTQTSRAQPALFVLEYALARLWMSWGIEPYALIGHSIGEYVAACLAGTLSLADALAVVARRGRLMQQLPSGAMLALPLSGAETAALLERDEWRGRVSLAAVNAPAVSVVAGPTATLAALESSLAARGVAARVLHTSHAFHSSMMDPIIEEFTATMTGVKLHSPRIPCLSNVTGTWLTDTEATDPGYYARHLRQTVRFSEGVQTAAQEFSPVFIEVGPGQALTTLVRKHRCGDRKPTAFPSLPGPKDAPAENPIALNTLGHLWLAGARIDWRGFHAGRPRRRISLPAYPFARTPHWVEAKPAAAKSEGSAPLCKRPNLDTWFSLPGWKSSPPARVAAEKRLVARRTCLVFRHGEALHEKIVQRLTRDGGDVVEVSPAARFGALRPGAFGLNPGARDDYTRLFGELQRIGKLPDLVVHLWPLGLDTSKVSGESDGASPDQYFFPLLFVAQALAAAGPDRAVEIKVITDGSVEVNDEGLAHPEKALVMGPCIVIPQEFREVSCSCIDVQIPRADPKREQRLLDLLAGEFSLRHSDPVVAYRGRQRWTRIHEACPLTATEGRPALLEERGVYLITGGLGGIGLELADHLARTVRARLVLVGRSIFPDRAAWESWLAEHGSEDRTSRIIQRLQEIKSHGGEVLVYSAEVADVAQMRGVVQNAREHFGRINGVIHSAGVAGGGAIQLKTPEAASAVLRAKVQGTQVLAEILADQPPDFMLLCSSINAVAGGFGQVDYCAANAFLDAFAVSHSARTPVRTLSVNWDTWAEVGMAVNTELPKHLREQRAVELRDGILPCEGQEVFARVLAAGLPQVVVSTRDFDAVRSQRRLFDIAGDAPASETPEPAAPLSERPELRTAYVAPQGDIEVRIAGIWQRCLGVDHIGMHDNFFELGGDSLLAVNVMEQIRRELKTSVGVVSFYETPTIALFAERLRGAEQATTEPVAATSRRTVNRVLAQRERRRQNSTPSRATQPDPLDS